MVKVVLMEFALLWIAMLFFEDENTIIHGILYCMECPGGRGKSDE